MPIAAIWPSSPVLRPSDIEQVITCYEEPHELVGQADYVMADPPFNVDEIDADKVKVDPRLLFGLPVSTSRAKSAAATMSGLATSIAI